MPPVFELDLKGSFNPFKPNGISHQQSISVLGNVGGIFHFYSNFYRTFCKQTVETLIRRHIVWHLIRVCAVCLCPRKKDARLIWVNIKFLVGNQSRGSRVHSLTKLQNPTIYALVKKSKLMF